MPMMNFYQLYPALLSNMKMSEDEVCLGCMTDTTASIPS